MNGVLRTPSILFIESLNDNSSDRSDSSLDGMNVSITSISILEIDQIGAYFAWSYFGLGIAALAINVAIIIVLIANRRHVLQNAFYVLIFDFALTDLLKGACIIALADRMLRTSDSTTVVGHLAAMRFNQYMSLVFRFCNLATVLNVLMITLNEYVYIKYPFRYERHFKRWMVLVAIFLIWLICTMVTVGSNFARRSTSVQILVPRDYGRRLAEFRQIFDLNLSLIEANKSLDEFSINSNIDSQAVLRSASATDVNNIITLCIIAFCLLCLVVIVWCYAVFIRIIKMIRKKDSRLYRIASSNSSTAISKEAQIPYGHHDEVRPKASCERRHRWAVDGTRTASFDVRSVSIQLLKRNKYAIVIGSVIVVYATYLISYATMQLLQYRHMFSDARSVSPTGKADSFSLSSRVVRQPNRVIFRWSLQILIGLHSIFQPLCYFRMREFRHFAKGVFCFPFSKLFSKDLDGKASLSLTDQSGRSCSAADSLRMNKVHGRVNTNPSLRFRRSETMPIVSNKRSLRSCFDCYFRCGSRKQDVLYERGDKSCIFEKPAPDSVFMDDIRVSDEVVFS